jgi:hypothetical protein
MAGRDEQGRAGGVAKAIGGGLSALEAAAGSADALAVGRVAALVDAVGPDGLRVREFPDVRA